MAQIINFQEVIEHSIATKTAQNDFFAEQITDENMTDEEKEQETLVNILLKVTETELKDPQNNELSLTIRLADLAHIAESYMDLLQKVADIQKAARELFEERSI
jgi:hypothetical protein